jgi:hypothetical protein
LEEYKTKEVQEDGQDIVDYELLIGLYPTTGTVTPPADQ